MPSNPAPTAHTLTLEFRRLLSEAEWREVVEHARQLPYVQGLVANAVEAAEGIAALPQAKWQPIDTAPKDGTHVLLGWSAEWAVGLPEVIVWLNGAHIARHGWHTYAGHHRFVKQPTHWMPLPSPPSALPQAQQEDSDE